MAGTSDTDGPHRHGDRFVSEPRERFVTVNGQPCRVWEKGEGEPVGYLAGLRGCPRWTPFLDLLAERWRVIVPSPPGFPGSPRGHHDLDDLPDWIAMTLDLLEGAGLDGADLIGASVGGMLAAEVAAFSAATVRKLVLVAPYGLYDKNEPSTMFFANTPAEQEALLSSNRQALKALTAPPDPQDEALTLEWEMEAFRAREASARLLWPFGERGLRKRLQRIRVPTLIMWGAEDRILPASYAQRFASGINGSTQQVRLEGAGHLADIDKPNEAATAVLDFLGSNGQQDVLGYCP